MAIFNTVYKSFSGGGGWQPGANTVAYYPLSVDFNDASGNGYNLTNTGGSITTVGGVNCAYYNGSSYSLNTSNPTFSGTYTISARRRPAFTSGVMGVALAGTASTNREGDYWGLQQSSGVIWASDWFTLNRSLNSNYTVSADTWYLLTTTVSNYRDVTIYVNGALKNSLDRGSSLSNQTGVIVGAKKSDSNTFTEYATGYISNVIFEDKVRTAQEISDYYNQTKRDYLGLFPQMSSNSQDGYILNPSSTIATFYAYNATNPDLTLVWVSDYNTGTYAHSLSMQMPTAQVATNIKLCARIDNTPAEVRFPSQIKLQGSNDGSSWTDLGEWTRSSMVASGEEFNYSFNNSTSYLYYRILLTASEWVSGYSGHAVLGYWNLS